MSWDISMSKGPCKECGESFYEEVRNVTYNNSKIFAAIGAHPDDYEGKTGQEAQVLVESAIAKLKQDREQLQNLEPSNGWGGINDSLDFLEKLLKACIEHPKATIQVH